MARSPSSSTATSTGRPHRCEDHQACEIFKAWGDDKYEQGKFGWPVEDQSSIDAGGESLKFQNGEIRHVNGKIEKDLN